MLDTKPVRTYFTELPFFGSDDLIFKSQVYPFHYYLDIPPFRIRLTQPVLNPIFLKDSNSGSEA